MLPTDPLTPVVMTKQEFDELPDTDLVGRCAAPMSRRMQVTSTAVRYAFLRRLTANQGAVLAFWILSTHPGEGLTGFCMAYPHRLGDANFWTLLETGLRQLDDGDMLALIGRLRGELARVLHAGEDAELSEAFLERLVEKLDALDRELMQELDEEYQRMMPTSLHLVARLIRGHAGEFVSVEG